MLLRKISISLSLILIFSFFIGCSKDGNDNPTSPENNNPPSLNVKQVDLPQGVRDAATNGNPGAMQVTTYTTVANSMASFASMLTPPQNANKAASVTATNEWHWTSGNLEVTLKVTQEGENYHWELIYNGTMDGQTYTNFKVLDAQGKTDGSEGSLSFYSPSNGGQALYTFNWTTLSNNTYKIDMITRDSGSSIDTTISYHSDESGTFHSETTGAGSWDAAWNSDGSGTYTEYDANGQVADKGSW